MLGGSRLDTCLSQCFLTKKQNKVVICVGMFVHLVLLNYKIDFHQVLAH